MPDTERVMTTHSLRRTSPTGKGQTFIGYCVNCGTINLPASAALDECPNPDGVTWDEGLMTAIRTDAEANDDD
jgi:uncharacterized OB-fold protein